MPGPIDIAYVEILPTLKNFGKQAVTEVKKALKGVSTEVDKTSTGIRASLANAFKGASTNAKTELDQVQRKIKEVDGIITVTVVVDGKEVDRTLKRDVSGKLRDAATGRFVTDGELAGLGITDGMKKGTDKGVPGVLSSLSNALSKVTPSFSARGVAITGAIAAGIAANPTALIASVAVIGGTLATAFAATIPAAVATAVAALATFKISLIGIEDALKDIGDAEKFGEALKNLAPSAQDFAKAVRDVLPQLKDLQQSVQQRFFVGFDADVKSLVATLSGPLKEGLGGIADEFNNIAHQVTAFATSGEGVSSLQSVLLGTKAILQTLAPAIVPLISAFATLAVTAQPILQQISAGVAQAIIGFSQFISQVSNSGALTNFLEMSLRVVSNLGEGFSNLGSIFASVFTGLGKDAESLSLAFVDITKSVKDFFATAEAQAVLAALGQVMDGLRESLQQILITVTPLLPAIAGLISGGFAVLKTTLDGILIVLGPVLDLFKGSQDTFTIIGGAIAGAVIALKAYEGVMALIKIATTAWTVVQLILNGALVANPIGLIVVAIGALVGGLIAAYKNSETFRNIVDAVGRALRDAFLATVKAVGDAISDIGGFFSDVGSGIEDAFNNVVKFFSDLPGNIASFFSDIGSSIGGFFSSIGSTISKGIDSFVAFFAALPGRLLTFVKDAFTGLLIGIGVGIGLILFAVLKLPGMILNALIALPGILATFFTNLWTSISTLAVNAWNALIAFFTALPGRIVGALTSLWTTLTTFFTSLWDSISSFFVSAWDGMIDFFTKLPGRFIAGIQSLAGTLGNFFSNLWKSIRDGVVNGWNSIIDWIRGVPGMILNLGRFFLNAGRDLIKGFFDGLSQAASFAGNIGSSIFNAFKDGLNWAIDKINAGINLVNKAIPGGDLPILDHLASGGLTRGPAIVGEAGPELAIPLTGQRGRKALKEVASAGQDTNEAYGDSGNTGQQWGAGQPVNIQLTMEVGSKGNKFDELLLEVLRKSIRLRGGNVQQVIGQPVGGVS